MDRLGFAKGKEFRGGKQTVRDKSISGFPKQFQRWFDRYYKQKGDMDRSYQEIKTLYDEWLKMGSPTVK